MYLMACGVEIFSGDGVGVADGVGEAGGIVEGGGVALFRRVGCDSL